MTYIKNSGIVMGTRIHKAIGYYLAKKDISKVLVKNYENILDNLYSVDKDFLDKMSIEMKKLTNSEYQIGFTSAKIQLQEILNNKKVDFDHFLKLIYNYDTFKGLLFQTPELQKSYRYDDLIDYYEQVKKPVFKLNLLKQSLYPDNYYICIRLPKLTQNALEVYALENPRKPILEVGDLITIDKLKYIMLYNNIKQKSNDLNTWIYPNEGEIKYFHPYVNILTYIAGKVANIIKPEISYVEFSQYLEPAIVTYWG